MRKILGLFPLALTLCLGASITSDRPLAQIRETTDKIVSLLNDPQLRSDARRSERSRLIREEMERRFDWPAIGRSCLGRHWAKLSAPQRSEFLDLFKQFLERNYLDRIEPYYNQLEKIAYLGEKILENNYASVKTVITTKEKIDHPVEYRLEKSASGLWRVYDVIIEGVSLVKNYRTQFDEILSRSSYSALADDLRAKIAAAQQALTP